jgi:hypothetical protein
MTTNVLVFDRWSKCELFKKYLGKTRTIKCHYSFDYNDALEKIKKFDIEIILLGGDVDDEELKSVILYNRMSELDLLKNKYIFFSTWNADEARILRDMNNKILYVPFSETLANIVKIKCRGIETNKRKKEKKKCQKTKN